MPTLADIRSQHPQYNDLSDAQLAGKLHQKFYSDMPYDKFNKLIGLDTSVKESPEPQGAAINAVGAVAEPAMQLASGAVAAPVAGIAGAVAAPFVGGERASEIIQGVQSKLTYQPQTVAGQAVSGAVAKPFEMLSSVAKSAGQKAQDMGASPAMATGIETAVNMLPSLVVPFLKGKGAAAAVDANALADQAAIKAGLDPAKIPVQIRKQLVAIAKQSAEKLKSQDPKALERESRMASHPVPMKPTTPQATRNPVQMKLEKQASTTDSGSPIRERFLDQNRQLQQNLDVLRGKTGAKVEPGQTEAAGKIIQGVPRLQLLEQKKNVRKLYKQAEAAGELSRRVDTQPLVDHYLGHVNPGKISYAIDYLKRKNVLEVSPDGSIRVKRPATLKELEELRKEAVSDARNMTSQSRFQSGEVVGVIDKMTEGTRGAPLYEKARAARRAMGDEFERTGSVRDLVSEKGKTTDRKVALEDTFNKVVLRGSAQDLRNVVRQLSSGSKRVQALGQQAVKELSGQTIDHIKEQATKGIAPMETGEPTFSASGFIKSVNDIGRPKLETLLGKESTEELFKLVETAKDVLTEPPTREVGSSTFSNILRWLDSHASAIPGAGPLATGAAKLASKAYQAGRTGAIARESLTTPLERAATPSQFTLSPAGKRGLKGTAAADVQQSERQ